MNHKVGSAAFGAFGITLLLIAYFFYFHTSSWIENSEAVDGTVTGYNENSHNGASTYATKYSYEYDGKTYRKAEKITNRYKPYDEGAVVKIYVNPNSPEDAKLDSNRLFLPAAIFGITGGVLLIISLITFGTTRLKPF
jgi:hypothetical protein